MRTSILFLLIFALAWSCKEPSSPDTTASERNERRLAGRQWFQHGVASGDPLPDRVIIWTRVSPQTDAALEVKWQVASDSSMQQIVRSGRQTADADRDFTIKADVTGLLPQRHYFYQFEVEEALSPVGRTRTAPSGETDQVNFAVVSCSNYEAGYFNAFARIADLDSIDAVLHLGDYIYEYETGRYGDTTLGRLHLPDTEIISLQDYRTRYALYRSDEDFQAVHQRHPFITIWDDHEITNNSNQSGAENHQPELEGDYESRKASARRAYFEWLPIRENEDRQLLYRHFNYGNLVDLIMLDERLEGRSPQVDSLTDPAYNNENRSMLGPTQLNWFKKQLTDADALWKIVGNQVIFSDLDFSAIRPQNSRNLDAWDGYPIEKKQIINFLKTNQIGNVILVTGDTHSSWAFEVPESIESYKAGSNPVAIELGTTSITSANLDERMSKDTVILMENALMHPDNNPQLKYVNLRDHGYLLLSIRPEEVTAEWRYVDDIRKRTTGEKMGKRLRIRRDQSELVNE